MLDPSRAETSTVHPRVCGERPPSPLSIVNAVRGSSPRVRGTRAIQAWIASNLNGSSPRVRGTRLISSTSDVRSRFIPACAGNAICRRADGDRGLGSSPRVRGTPVARCLGTQTDPVHPRVCGERVPCPPEHPTIPYRFIPACAGNASASVTLRADRGGSSPRVRGTQCSPPVLTVSHGSSPRVRGTRYAPQGSCPHRRFIPACAGNACCTVKLPA